MSTNRLAGMKCYLIGAMDRVADGGEGWRESITPFLRKKGVFVFNPCDKPFVGRASEEEIRAEVDVMLEQGRYDEIRPKYGDEIRGNDLRFVDESSFLICYTDLDVHPCGTYEELFEGNSDKKPVLVVCAQGKKHAPKWLFYALPHELIFDSFTDVKTYLNRIDSAPIDTINKLGRWRFFDWKRMVAETLAECPTLFSV